MNNSESIKSTHPLMLMVFWLYVTVPLAWGVWSTVKKAMALFS